MLKQELIAAQRAGEFVVTAFSEKASVHSLDEESRAAGGLIGRRMKQGVCQEPILDRACFCSPLGRVSGPIESSLGYHLVLVEERLGLEMHDEGFSRVVPKPRTSGEGVESVLATADPEEPSDLVSPDVLLNVLGFTVATYVGGQVIAWAASSFDMEALANSVN